MTPQLQQAIKLLQMSNLELAEFVEHAAEQNPLIAIEQGDGRRRRDRRRPRARPRGGAAGDGPARHRRRRPCARRRDLRHRRREPARRRGRTEADTKAPHRRRGVRARLSAAGSATQDGPSLEERLASRPALRDHLRAQLGQARDRRRPAADRALPGRGAGRGRLSARRSGRDRRAARHRAGAGRGGAGAAAGLRPDGRRRAQPRRVPGAAAARTRALRPGDAGADRQSGPAGARRLETAARRLRRRRRGHGGHGRRAAPPEPAPLRRVRGGRARDARAGYPAAAHRPGAAGISS